MGSGDAPVDHPHPRPRRSARVPGRTGPRPPTTTFACPGASSRHEPHPLHRPWHRLARDLLCHPPHFLSTVQNRRLSAHAMRAPMRQLRLSRMIVRGAPVPAHDTARQAFARRSASTPEEGGALDCPAAMSARVYTHSKNISATVCLPSLIPNQPTRILTPQCHRFATTHRPRLTPTTPAPTPAKPSHGLPRQPSTESKVEQIHPKNPSLDFE